MLLLVPSKENGWIYIERPPRARTMSWRCNGTLPSRFIPISASSPATPHLKDTVRLLSYQSHYPQDVPHSFRSAISTIKSSQNEKSARTPIHGLLFGAILASKVLRNCVHQTISITPQKKGKENREKKEIEYSPSTGSYTPTSAPSPSPDTAASHTQT